MRTKALLLALVLVLSISLFAGCKNKNNLPIQQTAQTVGTITTPGATTMPLGTGGINTTGAPVGPSGTTSPAGVNANNATKTPNATPDVITTASIVDNAAAFEKAISKNGTWIIAITKDLTISKDLVVEGEYKNGKKDTSGKDLIQRKIALYAQDANRKITARYKLTAPRITFTSPNASIQHGTFKGDVYVSVTNFQLIDATVEGNVYFTSNEYKSSFKMDATSKITGKQEVKKS